MEPFFYEMDVQVQSNDADFRKLLRPSGLLRFVEQVSEAHVMAFGMTDEFLEQHGATIMIGKQALQFFRVPRRVEKLHLITRSEGINRGSIKRITTVEDEAGETVAMVDSRWIIADLNTGHLRREPGWEVEGFYNDTVEGELPLKMHKTKELIPAGDWTASYSQCDFNGHINNTVYLDIACDLLPLEQIRAEPVRFVAVNYHRELLLGEMMQLFYAPSNQGWYVVGKRDGHMIFECYLELGEPYTES